MYTITVRFKTHTLNLISDSYPVMTSGSKLVSIKDGIKRKTDLKHALDVRIFWSIKTEVNTNDKNSDHTRAYEIGG